MLLRAGYACCWVYNINHMKNQTFTKSLFLLSHPISLVAIILMFLNDHAFRVYWPSWVTGKLSDFAWLFFMPFALAMLLALIIPSSVRNHQKIVRSLSYSTIGALFVLGNTIPITNQWISEVLEGILSIQIQITRDPTDLIALVFCGLSWLMWQKTETPIIMDRAKAFFLLPFVAILSIANSAAPDLGIDYLQIKDNKIIASASCNRFFESGDGGLSWKASDLDNVIHCEEVPYWNSTGERMVEDPDNKDILYRTGDGNKFEISNDRGKNWEDVPEILFASQAELAFYQIQTQKYSLGEPGPYSSLRDPQTSNLILSMGVEGVLVQKPSGEWVLVSVGDYGPKRLTASMIPLLLIGEILLALELALILFSSISFVILPRTWVRIVLLIPLWLAWMFVAVIMQPALNAGYGLVFQNIVLIMIGILALPYSIDSLFRVNQRVPQKRRLLIMLSLLGIPAFLFPFLLWSLNVIPSYVISMICGLLISAFLLIFGITQMKTSDLQDISA